MAKQCAQYFTQWCRSKFYLRNSARNSCAVRPSNCVKAMRTDIAHIMRNALQCNAQCPLTCVKHCAQCYIRTVHTSWIFERVTDLKQWVHRILGVGRGEEEPALRARCIVVAVYLSSLLVVYLIFLLFTFLRDCFRSKMKNWKSPRLKRHQKNCVKR